MFAQYRAYLKCAPTRYSRLRVAADCLAAKPERIDALEARVSALEGGAA